jgi:hypothetical protein
MKSSTGELSCPSYVTFEKIGKNSKGEQMGGSARRVGEVSSLAGGPKSLRVLRVFYW